MATTTLLPTSIVSSTGWAGVTAANLADNDLAYEATGGTAGEVIEAHITDAPADYGSGNSVTLAVQWNISGSASRAKNLLVELVGSDGVTIHASYTTPSKSGAGGSLDSSSAIALNLAAAELNASTLRVTVQEGGGKGDNVTTSVDYAGLTLDYNAAAVNTDISFAGTVPLQTLTADVGHTAPNNDRDVSFAGTVPMQVLAAEVARTVPNDDVSFAATVPLQTLAASVDVAAPGHNVSFAGTVPFQALAAEVSFVAAPSDDRSVSFAGTVPMQVLVVDVSRTVPDFEASFLGTLPVQVLTVTLGDGTVVKGSKRKSLGYSMGAGI